MNLKYKIVTANKWKNREALHAQIREIITLCPFIKDVQFTTVYKLLDPIVVNKRISSAWFDTLLSEDARKEGYTGVIFVFSKAQGRKWGVDSGLRGVSYKDGDDIDEMWVCSDERTLVKYPDGYSINRYVKTICHEIAHTFKHREWTVADIHDYDFENTKHDLRGFYSRVKLDIPMQWAKYLPEPYFSNITQGFAVPNPLYKVTGHHMGVDHGGMGKKDIPVFMPCDGRITRHHTDNPKAENYSKLLGNCAVILSQDEEYAFRFAHLRDVPFKPGFYKAGEQIGIMGNTGLSSGIHLHTDGHPGGIINIGRLKSRDDIIKYLVDPHALVVSKLT
jgi:hypothetical protein